MKKIFIILGILFVCGGWSLSFVSNDTELDPKVKEITGAQLLTKILELAGESSIKDTTSSKFEVASQTEGCTPSNQQINEKDEKVDLQVIKKQYREAFTRLEIQTIDKVNDLLSVAMHDFLAKRENEEKTSYYALFIKYKKAAEILETKTNKAFDQLYSALQNELVANGYDPNAASEFKEQYEATKKERKKAILKKILVYYN